MIYLWLIVMVVSLAGLVLLVGFDHLMSIEGLALSVCFFSFMVSFRMLAEYDDSAFEITSPLAIGKVYETLREVSIGDNAEKVFIFRNINSGKIVLQCQRLKGMNFPKKFVVTKTGPVAVK